MKLKNSILWFVMLAFGSIAFAQTTHMGVPPEDFVTLEANCTFTKEVNCNDAYPLSRTYADGSGGSVAFVIPEGKLLVITDVDWHWIGYFVDKDEIGNQVEFWLSRQNLGNSTLENRPIYSGAVIANMKSNSDFISTIGTHADTEMTSGFIVTSDAKLMYGVSENTGVLGVEVRGYLLPDQRR